MSPQMSAAELEKIHTLNHYRDVTAQAQAERRNALTDRREAGDKRLAILILLADRGCEDLDKNRSGGEGAPIA